MYQGEVVNYEDDLAGTQSNPVTISGFQARQPNGSYFLLDALQAATAYSMDIGEWDINVTSSSAVEIWDVNPR